MLLPPPLAGLDPTDLADYATPLPLPGLLPTSVVLRKPKIGVIAFSVLNSLFLGLYSPAVGTGIPIRHRSL